MTNIDKLIKAGTSITRHAARGKNLAGNHRTARMVARYNDLRKQAMASGEWYLYCAMVGFHAAHTGYDFFA